MIDWDAADKIVLDDEAAGNAVEHANEASHAGLDDQEQLFAGIRAYLQTMTERRSMVTGDFDPVTGKSGAQEARERLSK